MIRYFLALGLVAGPLLGLAQQPHGTHAYTDTAGTLYWNRHQPFYLRIAASATDTGVVLRPHAPAGSPAASYLGSEGPNLLRTRHQNHPQTGKPLPQPIELQWMVVADGKAPINRTSFGGAPHHVRAKQHFYGAGLHVWATATDALSGVHELAFSLNQTAFKALADTLHFDAQGPHSLRLYSTDHVGNRSDTLLENFIVDLSAPNTYLEVDGQNLNGVIDKNARLVLHASDSLAGVGGTVYRIGSGTFRPYLGPIDTKALADGNYQCEYYSTDWVQNAEEPKTFAFYLDKLPPILASDILGDRFIVNDQIYFSGRTKLKITAVDNKSGVSEVMYAIDDQVFRAYDQPFYLPSVPGIHVVRYYAQDHLGNRTGMEENVRNRYLEYEHNVSKVYVDLTGPTLDYSFVGLHFDQRDTVYVNRKTQIKLLARDSESGLQYTAYSVNGAQAETRYTGPFGLSDEGENNVEVFGYDNVNNRNRWNFLVYVDATAPQIIGTFSVLPLHEHEGLSVYPAHTTLYLAATDNIIGTQSILYALNNGPLVPYRGGVSGFRRGQINELRIVATDRLQNSAEQTLRFWIEK